MKKGCYMNRTVENIYSRGAEIAFVLESPHIDEVFNAYPLAGSAGREMSKYIFSRSDIPFGLVAHKRELICLLNISPVKPYSVINISRQPLQKTAYEANGIDLPTDIDLRETLKRRIDQNADYNTLHRDSKLNELKSEIYGDFKSECKNELSRYKFIVPCGRFARTFCEHLLAESSLSCELLKDIPHPSNGGWSSLESTKLDYIRQLLKE